MTTDGTFIYGGEGTIHGSDYVAVITDEQGKILRVEFRCMLVPFVQVESTSTDDCKSPYVEAESDYHKANYLPGGITDSRPVEKEGYVMGIRAIVFRERKIDKKPRRMLGL